MRGGGNSVLTAGASEQHPRYSLCSPQVPVVGGHTGHLQGLWGRRTGTGRAHRGYSSWGPGAAPGPGLGEQGAEPGMG